MSNKFNEEIGLFHKGAIVSYNEVEHTIKVQLNTSVSYKNPKIIDIPAPQSLFYNNGLFIGSKPKPGTPVIVGIGSGGQYYFVSYLSENISMIPSLKIDELLLRSNDKTKITLDLKNNINIGSDLNKIHISTDQKLISSNFNNNYIFTQASRNVDGLIKRDLRPNNNYDSNSKLENDDYESKLYIIPLDPSLTFNPAISGINKNPGRIEKREIVYEFGYDSDVNDDLSESSIYAYNNQDEKEFLFPNRRKSRSDTLSLSLVSPNFLMETIKGNVVDIFGNILDLNRAPLKIGVDNASLQIDKNTDKVNSFLEIKKIDRKGIAYHFEINAKKDLINNGKFNLPDVGDNTDYSRNRSRFFIDIDKEGQVKINIPSSSETGNIPLLTRYENYSTFGQEDNNNPNKLFFREDKIDIFHDSFASPRLIPYEDGFTETSERGSVLIKDGDLISSPIDRITGSHIKWGTAFHDILNTCYVHQDINFLNYQNNSTENSRIKIEDFSILTEVVKSEINVSGDNANAGGRSLDFSTDGSVTLNFGANSSDRLSLIGDLAGGMVLNVGRDLKNRSAMINCDGEVYIQIGGYTVTADSRFEKQYNGMLKGVLDLRVVSSGSYTHMLRIDDSGITVMTPGTLKIHSKGDLNITSDSNMNIESENLYIQGRLVNKNFGGSI